MKIENVQQAQRMMKDNTLAGIHECSNEIYHAIPAISKTQLDKIKVSAKHYKAAVETPREPTTALNLGSAIHAKILEPETFDKLFVIPPKEVLSKSGSKAGNKYKEWLAGQDHQATILKSSENDLIDGMFNSVTGSPVARQLLKGYKEKAFFCKCPVTGLWLKCKPDVTHLDLGVFVDLKKTRDASERHFIKATHDYGYHRQAAFYMDVATEAVKQGGKGQYKFKDPDSFVFIAVEEAAPYAVAFYDLEKEFIQEGRDQYKLLLNRLACAVRSNIFEGYPQKIKTLCSKTYMYTSRDGRVE